ncbi:MAG: hypothetical protein CVT67_07960 [Actinobacteria bacterium HGW-Actinobacteria-7]|nr:MAG: hypothetical protein CVT67_07960 [Actinobacteria bacterium HGW-Actinobacteria-7]
MIAKTNWAHVASELTKAIGLSRQPVGIKLLRSAAEFDSWDVEDARAATYYCAAVKQASNGRAFKLGPEQFRCESSRQILGLEALPHEPYYSASYSECGLHRDKHVSGGVVGDMAVVPRTVLGIVVQPVALFTDRGPDVVIVMGNAYQSMRMMQGYTFHQGEVPALRSVGQHGICSESTAEPILSGTLNVSLLCSGTRFYAKWDDDEVATSLPGSLFAVTVDGVLQTINPCEPDSRKREIALDPPDADIELGSSYFIE